MNTQNASYWLCDIHIYLWITSVAISVSFLKTTTEWLLTIAEIHYHYCDICESQGKGFLRKKTLHCLQYYSVSDGMNI